MKKIRQLLLPMICFLCVFVCLFSISCFAFKEDSFSYSYSPYVGRDDLTLVFSDEYDIVPCGRLVTDDMQGSIGAVSWEDYCLLHSPYSDYAYYLANSSSPVYAVEYIVVQYHEDQIQGVNHRYSVVSDGNYFFPETDIAVYYENGLRVVKRDEGMYFSFLSDFVDRYCSSATTYDNDINRRYQLYYVAYHTPIISDTPGASITQEKYDQLLSKYSDEKYARIAAQEQLETKVTEIAKLEKEKEALTAEKNTLISEKKDLSGKYDALKSEYTTLSAANAELQGKYDGIKNNVAVLDFFQGIYDTVHGVLIDFFDLEIFGISFGSVVCMLLCAGVVIFVLKLVF